MRGGFLRTPPGDGFLAAPFVDGTPAPSGGPMDGVTQDATSLKYVPASVGEWTTTMSVAGIATGNPSALWLCQEASGNLADSIGSFTLTAASTPTYQTAVAGWTRKGINLTNGSSDGFSSASASLPDLGVASQLVLAYFRVPGAAPAATRSFITIGGSGTRASLNVTTTPRLDARSVGNTATGAANPLDGGVHAMFVRVNRTAMEVDAGTEAEKLSPTASVSMDNMGILFGNAGFLAADSELLYAASFHGAAAELSDAQIRTLLQTLNWTVAW